MLVAIIGENCVGKSTLAKQLNGKLNARCYSGKDYLRLYKTAAEEAFKERLKEAVSGENMIYIITEEAHLKLLPEGAFRIVLTADLDTIKARFRERMRGNLPQPVEKMLEAKHGVYDALPCDLKLDNNYSIEKVLEEL